MSTLRTCPGGDALVSLLYDDFEPGAVPSRDDLEAHVRACATCLAEFEALGGVRAQLAAWTAPDVALGFEVVRTGTPRRSAGARPSRRGRPAARARCRRPRRPSSSWAARWRWLAWTFTTIRPA